jgi:hypothetical protein
VLAGPRRFAAIGHNQIMISLGRRPAGFDAPRVDVHPWLWACAGAAILTGAFLLVLGTLEESAAPLTRGGDSARSPLDKYVELRLQVEATVPAARVTTDAGEILAREAALGAAMQAARLGAAQGEFFTPAVATDVREAIAADFARRSPADRAGIMSDVPDRLPRVNEPYPVADALATFPPLLLQALPRLTADLEYRFMGRHLIIRDSRTNLIVDYLLDVT